MTYLEKVHSENRQRQLYLISPHFSGMDHLDHQTGWFQCNRSCNLKCNHLMAPFSKSPSTMQVAFKKCFASVLPRDRHVLDLWSKAHLRASGRDARASFCISGDADLFVCKQRTWSFCLMPSKVLILKETLLMVFFAGVSAALCPQCSGRQIFELQHMTWKIDCDELKTRGCFQQTYKQACVSPTLSKPNWTSGV